jgi:hypothetical protein
MMNRIGKALSFAALCLTAVSAPMPASDARAPAGASNAVGTTDAAALRFSPAVLDLGELTIGTAGEGVMTVTNAGGAPVAIAAIRPACGCTKVSSAPTGEIAPGESFAIAVSLDPGKKPGANLVRSVHVALVDGSVETFEITARVRTVIAIEPAVLEVAASGDAAVGAISLASIDGADFALTGAVPAGVLSAARTRSVDGVVTLALDAAEWERAGRPTTVVLATDRRDAPELIVPIRSTEAVAMFRLPAATGEGARRARLEARQGALLREIDAGLGGASMSSGFRMRLHRESGMLFVHGTARDLDAVRTAVAALPGSSGVRESGGGGPAAADAAGR